MNMSSEHEQLPRQAIDLGDTAQIKRVLDEVASQVVLDAGYPENFTISNRKIALGLLTCGFALVAQFYPKTYPHITTVQVLCVVGYFLLNTLLQVYMMTCERDIILFTNPKTEANTGICLSTNLPRFADKYKIVIACSESKSASAARPPTVLERSIVDWFYEDGHLADDVFKKDVVKLLKQYESAETRKELKDR